MNVFKKEEEYDLALQDAAKIKDIDPTFLQPQLNNKIIPELEKLQK